MRGKQLYLNIREKVDQQKTISQYRPSAMRPDHIYTPVQKMAVRHLNKTLHEALTWQTLDFNSCYTSLLYECRSVSGHW